MVKFKEIWKVRQYRNALLGRTENDEWFLINGYNMCGGYDRNNLTEADLIPYKGNLPIDKNGNPIDEEHVGRLAYEFEVRDYDIEAETYKEI